MSYYENIISDFVILEDYEEDNISSIDLVIYRI